MLSPHQWVIIGHVPGAAFERSQVIYHCRICLAEVSVNADEEPPKTSCIPDPAGSETRLYTTSELRPAVRGIIRSYRAAEIPDDGTAECLLSWMTTHIDRAYKLGQTEAVVQKALLKEALEAAETELENIAGWSGSFGNWPLQEALAKVRAALGKKRA